MGTVAERLVLRFAAGTPPVLTSFKFGGIGGFLSNDWFHIFLLGKLLFDYRRSESEKKKPRVSGAKEEAVNTNLKNPCNPQLHYSLMKR